MFVYIFLAFIVGLFAIFENGEVSLTNKRKFYAVLFIFLIIVGFRYWHGDYGTYEKGYYDDVDVGSDAGYFFLQKLFHHAGLSFQFFVFCITLVSVYAFKRFAEVSKFPIFFMLVVLGKIFTLYAMSGIRQYMAMAICWWAIADLLRNKAKWRFFALVFIAYTLHGSAIIVFPVYFLRNLKFKYTYALLMFAISIVFALNASSFFTQVGDMSDVARGRFLNYVQASGQAGGMNMLNYFENFLFLLFALLVRKKVLEKIPFYDFFLYLLVIYCGFLIVGGEIGIVKRLRDYFVVSYAILVPAFGFLFNNRTNRQMAKYVFIAYFIMLFFRSLIVYDAPFPPNYYGRMIPYHSVLDMNGH